MRYPIAAALLALVIAVGAETVAADQDRCSEQFPGVDWVTVEIDAPMTMATAGMNSEMASRFASDVERNANLIHSEIGGLQGSAACLASPELAPAFSEFVGNGQRLHAGVFGEERLFVLSAVEIRTVDDAIAFGLPHIALWQIADELGFDDGYPDPLGSTIAHWYLARDTDRMARYQTELVVAMFLDDPNPELRTLDDAAAWVVDTKGDPFFFDPQFAASQMGVFVDYAVSVQGPEVIRDPSQETWGTLENQWRISLRDELPRGSFGLWWGVAIVVVVLLLALVLALVKRWQNQRAAQRMPTPPVDESLFPSAHE